MILVATWKWWVVPLLVLVGIGGMLFRGLLDISENWATGYGPGSKKASIQAFTWLGLCILAAILLGVLG